MVKKRATSFKVAFFFWYSLMIKPYVGDLIIGNNSYPQLYHIIKGGKT